MRRKLFKYGLWTFGTILIVGLFYLFHEIREFEKESERLCDHGHGDTSLKLRILDFNTDELIDSVRLTIRYGASADRLVDTLLKQEENIAYNFNVPEIDDCESYWFELSNDLYWEPYYLKDSTQDVGIKKGKMNIMTLYMKPATKVKTRVINKLTEFEGDTVFVDFERSDGEDVTGWTYFTKRHFEKYKTSSELFHMESGAEYRAIWVHKNKRMIDTTYTSFYAKPFDTLLLKFELKDKMR